METFMKKINIKTCALIVFGLGATALTASTTNLAVEEDASGAKFVPTAALNPCVFDFSPEKTKDSLLKMAIYLSTKGGVLTADSPTTLYTDDLTYLMLESVAAWVRQNPSDCPKLLELFADTSSVHKAFFQLLPKIEAVEDDLSLLADLEKCKEFVNYMLEKDLPLLIDVLRQNSPLILVPVVALAESYEDEIIKVAKTFTPEIANLLNSSYVNLSKMVQVASNEVPSIIKSNYKYLPYAALAAGAVGVFVAMLRGFGVSSSGSSKK